ncbi:hypothetical protein F5Y06DRAFT_280577 [Hypoxylon sp. FL0890]|nr:hypothetical protein F5Y06DRAFT_280577 [Hypoxylon sp. FL0890]
MARLVGSRLIDRGRLLHLASDMSVSHLSTTGTLHTTVFCGVSHIIVTCRWDRSKTLTVTRLGAFLRNMAKFVAVAALNLLLVGTVFGAVAFLTTVVACTTTTAFSSSLGTVLGEMTSCSAQLVTCLVIFGELCSLTSTTLAALYVVRGATRLGT